MEETMSEILTTVRDRAQSSGRFAAVTLDGTTLRCRAKGADACYVVDREGEGWAVSLLTADRWLSESIEGDMLEGRDTAEELVDDELVDVGFPGRCQPVKHFRDDAKQYVFRSRVPLDGGSDAAALTATYLLAFEAAFANLGDMQGGDAE
jgi:hypothetical protein